MAVSTSLIQNKRHMRVLRSLCKWLLYALCAAFCVFLSLAWYALGTDTVSPLLLCGIVAAVGMREGIRSGAVFGLLAGLFSDAAGGGSVYTDVLFYALVGFFAGLLAAQLFRAAFPIWLPVVFVFAMLRYFADVLFAVWTVSAPLTQQTLSDAVLFPAVLTALLPIPLWFLTAKIAALTQNGKKHTALKPHTGKK